MGNTNATTYAITTRDIEEEEQTAAMFATLIEPQLEAWLQTTYVTVAAYLRRFGVGPVGRPYARYHRNDDGTFEVEAGYAATTPVPGEKDVEPSEFAAGPVATTIHVGPHAQISAAYAAIAEWLTAQGATAVGDPWEVYLGDARTEVVQPYAPI
jgi:effector-binding domain-containing protein